MSGFLIGPNLRDKLKQTITRVDAMPYSQSGPVVERRFEDQPSTGTRLRRGTFTGSWSIGESKSVTLVTDTAATVAVTNYCVGVTQPTNQTALLNVVFCNVMGTTTAVEIQPHRDTSTCVMTIAGASMTAISGYAAGEIQLLGHTAADLSTNRTACATLQWFSVTACSTATAT